MKPYVIDLLLAVFLILLLCLVPILLAVIGDRAMDDMLCSLYTVNSWQDVRVEVVEERVNGCDRLGGIEAGAALLAGTESADRKAEELAVKRLRKAAWKAGGNVVLVTKVTASNGRARAVGVAYRCG